MILQAVSVKTEGHRVGDGEELRNGVHGDGGSRDAATEKRRRWRGAVLGEDGRGGGLMALERWWLGLKRRRRKTKEGRETQGAALFIAWRHVGYERPRRRLVLAGGPRVAGWAVGESGRRDLRENEINT